MCIWGRPLSALLSWHAGLHRYPCPTLFGPLSAPCPPLVRPLSALLSWHAGLHRYPCPTLVRPLSGPCPALVRPLSALLSWHAGLHRYPCPTLVRPLFGSFKPLLRVAFLTCWLALTYLSVPGPVSFIDLLSHLTLLNLIRLLLHGKT